MKNGTIDFETLGFGKYANKAIHNVPTRYFRYMYLNTTGKVKERMLQILIDRGESEIDSRFIPYDKLDGGVVEKFDDIMSEENADWNDPETNIGQLKETVFEDIKKELKLLTRDRDWYKNLYDAQCKKHKEVFDKHGIRGSLTKDNL